MLQPGEALTAIKSTLALAWGLAAILLITPLMSFAVLKLPLQPPAMALGLAIYCCMPTSLSTNIALTQVSRNSHVNRASGRCLPPCSRGGISQWFPAPIDQHAS